MTPMYPTKIFELLAPNLQPWQVAILEDALNEQPLPAEAHAELTKMAQNLAFQSIMGNPESHHDSMGVTVNPPTP